MAMTYELRGEQPEPMSRRAIIRLRDWMDNDAREENDVLMTSARTQQLSTYLRQYCDGHIDGFSVLLAGQRGAGKTTLTKLVIQDAIRKGSGLIPLPIFLHGPTVIDRAANSKEKKTKAVDPAAQYAPTVVINFAQPATDAAEPSKADPASGYFDAIAAKECALPKMMTAMYRALGDAICDAWRNAAYHSSSGRRSTYELLELAAHLDRTLDLAPGVESLRKIWSRAGFLHNGVAFYLRPHRTLRVSVQPEKVAGHEADQGLREIIALAACAEAYRAVIGRVEEKVVQSFKFDQSRQQGLPSAQEAAEKKKDEEKTASNAKETVKALAPPAVGAAVGIAAAFGPGHFLGVAAGVIGWAASWFALNYSTNRSSKTSQDRESKFDIDWDAVRVLERRFPALIRRVKDAGFAPIFVLDELDKVPNAFDKLYDFLLLTKHIVTDEASFFFLVNRNYYERMERLDRNLQ
jgi:hypothetical protein